MASLSKVTDGKRLKKRQKAQARRLKRTARDLRKAAKAENVIVIA